MTVDLMSNNSLPFTAREIAVALGIKRQPLQRRAVRDGWTQVQLGKTKPYLYTSLPKEIQFILIKKYPERFATQTPTEQEVRTNEIEKSISLIVWDSFQAKSTKSKERSEKNYRLLLQVMALHEMAGHKLKDAFAMVAEANGVSYNTMRRWYYGKPGKPGVKDFERRDWLAVLADERHGRSRTVECDPQAWDWLCAHYLSRKQPSFADSCRRLQETAKAHGWTIPSEKTLKRRMDSDIAPQTVVFRREGPEALRRLYPTQKRDKRCFAAGEAVNGDGLKFDRLYVQFPDGEVVHGPVGWFWQDLYSGKLLAYRAGKTENMDIFRLSMWDLTALTLPSFAWIDNTRVAACKAMTGQNPHRNRFKATEKDPVGVLIQLGIDVHFTDPDHAVSNPGVKPIERAFGIGGLHEAVATHPRFKDRGYNTATAIPFEEFSAVLADEVRRFNAREGRRGGVCNGRSVDVVFAEGFKKAIVRKPNDIQRRLLLLLPEVVRANKESGQLGLKAGQGPEGRNCYWNEALVRYRGKNLVAYFDPENLSNDVHVYDLDGKYLCDAQHYPSVAFNDTEAAREWNKNKRRKLKAQRIAAKAEQRMSDIEAAALYPSPEGVVEPKPQVLRPLFGGTGRVEIDEEEKLSPERRKQLEAAYQNSINEQKRAQQW